MSTICPDSIQFPVEMMQEILSHFPHNQFLKQAVGFLAASKKIRQVTIEAMPKCSLTEMNIHTFAETIQFAMRFGEHLTYIDISKIKLDSESCTWVALACQKFLVNDERKVTELLIYLPRHRVLVPKRI